MNAEGAGVYVAPELLQAAATGLLVLLAAYWILRGLGLLWRRTVWLEGGGAVTATAQALNGRVEPVWTGWAVETSTGSVVWSGGLSGLRTRVQKHGGPAVWADGILGVDAVVDLLR